MTMESTVRDDSEASGVDKNGAEANQRPDDEVKNSDNGSTDGNHDDLDELSDENDLPADASLHAADLVKKRLEEIDPCEKLRALCKKGEVDELDEFLRHKSETGVDLDYVSSDGWTCLHEIITHGCQFTEVARVLLKYGAKVNTTDFNQDTPLHASLLYHNTENVKLLLEHGADTEMANAIGRKPIHNANDAESLELLIQHGADIDSKDMNGNTAVHYAVMAKDEERVKLLVAKSCDLGLANGAGSTALHLASDPDIARLLFAGRAAADVVNAVDKCGNSPLHVAVRGRHKETARVLVENNADSHAVNLNGKSPVSLAKDKEMRNILCGTANGNSAASASTPTPTGAANKKQPKAIVDDRPVELPGRPELRSPSILKRKRPADEEQPGRQRTGPRLRFSEVNDYSGVEEPPPMEKRVRASPMYTEPDFTSDEDDGE